LVLPDKPGSEMKNRSIKSVIGIIFFLLPVVHLGAQEGSPYISQIDPGNFYDRQIFDIEHDNDQVMYFATRRGIYTYDSESRGLMKLPAIPLALELDRVSGKIYTGCRNNVGYISKKENGQLSYYSFLAGLVFPDDYYMISQDADFIYFAGENNLYRFRKNNTEDYLHFQPDSAANFAGFFSFNGKTFIKITGQGIAEITDSLLKREDFANVSLNAEILFSCPYTAGKILVGTDENRLFTFDGQRFELFRLRDQKYLDESVLSDGIEVDTASFAISTLMGGCMIIDKFSGKTVHIINIRNGLPDDEIFSIGKDLNNGIWLSHGYGLSRIDTKIPVMNYNSYPGIKGTIVNAAFLNDQLYISTTEGIFFLEEKRDYVTKEVIVEVKPEQAEKPEQVEGSRKEAPKIQVTEEDTGAAKEESLLSKREVRKLRRQLKKESVPPVEKKKDTKLTKIRPGSAETDTSAEPEAVSEEPSAGIETREKGQPAQEKQLTDRKQPSKEKSVESEKRTLFSILRDTFKKPGNKEELDQVREETIYRKQRIYSLQSISHEFVKVPGLNRKADILVNFNDRILAGGTSGFFEIVDRKAVPVFPSWRVEFIEVSKMPGRVFVGTENSVYLLELVKGKWVIFHEFREIPVPVFSVCEDLPGNIWIGGDNVVHNLRVRNDSVRLMKSYTFTGEVYDPVYARYINNTVFFFLSSDIYKFSDGALSPEIMGHDSLEFMPEYYFSEKGIAWIRNFSVWSVYCDPDKYDSRLNLYLNLYPRIRNLITDDTGNLWIIDESGKLDKIVAAKIPGFDYKYFLSLSSVTDQNNESYNLDDLSFTYEDRSISFKVSAPFYPVAQSSQYQYYIEGIGPGWNPWTTESDFSFQLLPHGKYVMHIRARDILGKLSNESIVSFAIKPPFWSSWWFLTLCGLVFASLVFLVIRIRIMKLQKDKSILEQKVWERTVVIKRQKDEIEVQKQEIMDSILYAERIQKAVLPSHNIIQKILPENFILFLPRDIVSGDFYWMTTKDNYSIFAAVDCTGHGVPGAFMSMLGVSFLNGIVNESKQLKANLILKQLRELVKTTLSQSYDAETKDGMDIALCILNNKTNKLQFAGAFNPLYLIRDNNLMEIKGDRMPIGIYRYVETDFTNNEIQLQKADCLYIFSDGYVDQFGGIKGKKFLTRNLKETLLRIHSKPMKNQKELLQETLRKWKGDYKQIDDILIIGLRI
jgi:serine phosphatase RsbU (regulator of sigma subunit)